MFDINTTPFSRRGSYCAISKIGDTLYIRDVHGGDSRHGCLFAMDMLDLEGRLLSYSTMFKAHKLCLCQGNATLTYIMPRPNILRIKGNACKLRLSAVLAKYDHVNKLCEITHELHSYSCETKMRLILVQGLSQSHIVWQSAKKTQAVLEFFADGLNADGDFELVLERYAVVPLSLSSPMMRSCASFEDEATEIKTSYQEWVEGYTTCIQTPQTNFTLEDSALTHSTGACMHAALYLLWASLVEKAGILPCESMYMSKHYMTNVWSWDHCFIAIALASWQPQLAYEQYTLFKKFQHDSGALPDYVNDVFASYACVKPLIQGWAYQYMMRRSDYFTQETHLLEVYDMLVKLNEYWLYHRMSNVGLPYYNHGNDSGWDNATVFDQGCPVITPDLASYLVLNCEASADIALRLGKDSEARRWNEKAEQILHDLLTCLYDGTHFYTRQYTNVTRVQSKSLLHLMPIVLGQRLPGAVLKSLLAELLSEEYYTEWGFATESLSSSLYKDAGYWRGPVWPMTTMLIIDGLQRSGALEFADGAASHFLRLVERSGMYENFDARSGVGLEDSAFTCTASVYLLLLRDYGMEHMEDA